MKTEKVFAIADSGSPMLFLNKKKRTKTTKQSQVNNIQNYPTGGRIRKRSML